MLSYNNSDIYKNLYSEKKIDKILSDKSFVNKILIFEKMLLKANYQLKNIPHKAYKNIIKAINLQLWDLEDAKRKGVFVDFFDKPASTHKGAALFHLNTDASLIYGICVQENMGKYRVEFIPINPTKKSVEDITQLYTTIIEQSIKKYPEQYFWFHNRWKTKK